MPRPNIPPWNQPGGSPPNLPPYMPMPEGYPTIPGTNGPNLPPHMPMPPGYPPMNPQPPSLPGPGGSGPGMPTGGGGGGHQPPLPNPGTGGNPWNPYGSGNGGGWDNPFSYPTYGGEYQNWRPDMGENGAEGFYQRLISTDAETSGSAMNEYVKALSNNLLTSGYFSPSQASIYYGTLNPEMQYGLPENNDVLPYNTVVNDTEAQQWYKPEYWDSLSQQLSNYTSSLFGGMTGDQSEGNQDMVEKANRWLRDVVDMGRRYSGEGKYWSTANARDRKSGWDYLQSQAGALGLGEEFMNLGSSLYNPGVGQGPVETYLNTGAFRRRNQNYQ